MSPYYVLSLSLKDSDPKLGQCTNMLRQVLRSMVCEQDFSWVSPLMRGPNRRAEGQMSGVRGYPPYFQLFYYLSAPTKFPTLTLEKQSIPPSLVLNKDNSPTRAHSVSWESRKEKSELLRGFLSEGGHKWGHATENESTCLLLPGINITVVGWISLNLGRK